MAEFLRHAGDAVDQGTWRQKDGGKKMTMCRDTAGKKKCFWKLIYKIVIRADDDKMIACMSQSAVVIKKKKLKKNK